MTPSAASTCLLPLGGCGEIGMNLNLYGHQGRWLMVDCGLTFEQDPHSTTGRPSLQMPDPRFITRRRQQLDGIVITHAHEDHLGALPYLWQQFGCPVYTTPFTAAVLRRKAGWRGVGLPEPLIEVTPNTRRHIGVFDVQWLPLTHSTPETCALFIRAGGSRILHTADWKIDGRPVVGSPWRPSCWQDPALTAVDAVVCDSTNALKPGRSPAEGDVADGLLQTIAPLTGKVVVACFASNIARLQSLLRIAQATGRRAALLGRSLDNMYRCARANDLLLPDFKPIEAAHLEYLPPQEVLAIATGSQGEVGAALHKLGLDTHPMLSVGEGDTVIFSARTIPGNEAAVARTMTYLQERGVRVLHADSSQKLLHASGHPCADELKALYETVRPNVTVPVHGEPQHMIANARIARDSGVATALTGSNGDLFYLFPTPGIRRRWVETGRLEWLESSRQLVPVSPGNAGRIIV